MYITKVKITKIQSLTSFTQIREFQLLANLLEKYFYGITIIILIAIHLQDLTVIKAKHEYCILTNQYIYILFLTCKRTT